MNQENRKSGNERCAVAADSRFLGSLLRHLAPVHSPIPIRVLLLALTLLTAPLPASAQELKTQPTPFSAWLDFKTIATGAPSKAGLPIWIESIDRFLPTTGGSVVRLRLRKLGPLNDQLLLRLYFRDQPGAAPTVSGWTETGTQPYYSGPLGSGLGLDTSESLLIAAADLDYIDIESPGDGSNLRGAYLSSLRRQSVWHALDFAPAPLLLDPFGAPASLHSEEDDTLLQGRIRATIDTEPLKLTPPSQIDAVYQFELDTRPLFAALSFEVLGADPFQPIQCYVGGVLIGTLALAFPDLADPGYRGESVPLEPDLRIRYSGWLHGQVLVPGSRLVAGLNTLVLRVNQHSSPVVIRAVSPGNPNPPARLY